MTFAFNLFVSLRRSYLHNICFQKIYRGGYGDWRQRLRLAGPRVKFLSRKGKPDGRDGVRANFPHFHIFRSGIRAHHHDSIFSIDSAAA